MKPEEIKEIQRQSFERLGKGLDHGVQFRHKNSEVWIDAPARLDGSADRGYANTALEYRIRPETVNVFGVELPVPLQKIDDEQTVCWVDEINWSGVSIGQFYVISESDARMADKAVFFKSSEDAKSWHDFFIKCRKGEFAQKPKKKVTIEEVIFLLEASVHDVYVTRAQRIIDLFERDE